ncbi:MAG: ORF6N domain-containing protein [Sulfurovum sp.]|nr:ORF6N domain-containing protein [Sulfurovum sp.]
MDELLVQGEINSKILTLRGRQVMLDRDLAELYEIETKVFNQSVKRNADRFPDDFMFQLTEKEYENLRSQFVTSNKGRGGRRYMPYAFTEEGIYMLATVLNSKVAVQTNIAIIRTFKKLREFSKHYNALAKQIIEIDRKHDQQYKALKKALDELIASSEVAGAKVMGFLK